MNLNNIVFLSMMRRRKRTIAMLLIIGIAMTLMAGIFVVSASQGATAYEWELDGYGEQDMLFVNTRAEDAALLSQDSAVSETAVAGITGSVEVPGGSDGISAVIAGTMGDAFRDMTRIALLSGEWPSGQNEVVIEKDTAETLGLQAGDSAELTYYAVGQDTPQMLTVMVTGIMENYRSLLWDEYVTDADTDNPLPSIIFDDKASVEAPFLIVALKLNSGDRNTDTIQRLANSVNAASAVNGSTVYASLRQRISSVMLGVAAVIGLLMTILLIHSFDLFAMERGRELSLMRAVGATTVQLRAMIRTEALLLSAAALPTGIIAGILLPLAGVIVLNILRTGTRYYFSVPWFALVLLQAASLLLVFCSAGIATYRFYGITPLTGMKTGGAWVRKSNIAGLLRSPQRLMTFRYFRKNKRLIATAVFCSMLSLISIGIILFVTSLLGSFIETIVADYTIAFNMETSTGVDIDDKPTRYNITEDEKFSEEEISQIQNITGVKAVHASRIDKNIVLTLTKEQQSDYFQLVEYALYYNGTDWVELIGKEYKQDLIDQQVNLGFDKDDLLLDQVMCIGLDDDMLSQLMLSSAQKERIRQGESAIVVTPDYISVEDEHAGVNPTNGLFFIRDTYTYDMIQIQNEGSKMLYSNTSLYSGDTVTLSKAIPADNADGVEIVKKQVTIEQVSTQVDVSLGLSDFADDGILILCYNDLLKDWAQTDDYGYLSVYTDENIPSDLIDEQLRALLSDKSHVDIDSKGETAELLGRLSGFVILTGLFLAVLTAVILTMMMIGNSSLMLSERRSELGILLATGMRRRGIRRILYGQIHISMLPGIALAALFYFLIGQAAYRLIGFVVQNPFTPWMWMGAAAAVLISVQILYLKRQADRFAGQGIVDLIRTIE